MRGSKRSVGVTVVLFGLVVSFAVWLVTLLGAYLNDGEYRDGQYIVTYSHVGEEGYQSFLEITVEDGLIVGAVFDAMAPDGMRKSQNVEYRRRMREASGVTPLEYTSRLEVALISAQSAEVAAVSGATRSSNEFRELIQTALPALSRGNPRALVVQLPDTQNQMTPRPAISPLTIQQQLLDHQSSNVRCGSCGVMESDEEVSGEL